MTSEGSADVLIVGGGVIGASVAFHLAREGVGVRLLERGEPASQASGAAAGMLLPLGEAREKGPFLSFGLRSLARFPELCAELLERSGIDPELEPSGALHVAGSEARADTLRARARDLPELGARWIDAQEACERAPTLRPDVRGALWSPMESHLRSPQLARAYLAAAEARGARIDVDTSVLALAREGDRVVGARTTAGSLSGGQVVVCAGSWSPALVEPLGVRLPIEPVKGHILSLEAPDAPRCILQGDDVYLVPKRDGRLVVGATEEHVGFDAEVRAPVVAELLGRAFALAPSLEKRPFDHAWAGLRPCTPDHLPALGPVPGLEGLLLACGHHRNGVLLSPASGECIADAVLGRSLPDDAAAFDPGRFALGAGFSG